MNVQGHKFSISHRKGKEHIVPDALSRMYNDELLVVENYGPKVDLESPSFQEDSYNKLKNQILAEPGLHPDLKIIDKYIYISELSKTMGRLKATKLVKNFGYHKV